MAQHACDEDGLITDPSLIAMAVGFAKAWWTDHRQMMIDAGVPTVTWDDLPEYRQDGYANLAAQMLLAREASQ